MNILIVTQYFYPETFRVNALAVELKKRGHSVTVLTGYPQYPKGEIYPGYGFGIPYEKEWNGVKIERVKMRPRGHNVIGMLLNCITFVTEGKKWVRRCEEKYDAIYVFEVSPVTVGLPALKYKKKFGTPIFFNVQDLWPENVQEVLGISNRLIIGVINKIVDKIYKESDMILCSSNGFVNNIKKRGVDEKKIKFWPQFCESPDFSTMIEPKRYNEDYFNVVFAGNIGDAQGLDLLINAADILREEKVRWHIVGDGRSRESLEKMVREKCLEDQVKFVGRVSEADANGYITNADCAYLSFKDCKLFDLTIPAKLQTYLACGTPILGAVGGESAEIIFASKSGLITKKTPESVANAVRELMALNDSERVKMKESAQAYYRNMFTIDIAVDNLIKYISDVKDFV